MMTSAFRLCCRFFLSFVLLYLSFSTLNSAKAQSCTKENPCDQGTAYAGANSDAISYAADRNRPSGGNSYAPRVSGPNCSGQKCYYRCAIIHPIIGSVGCGVGGYQLDWYYWADKGCGSRPEQIGGWAPGPSSVCYQGCTYHSYTDPSVGNYWSTFNSDTNSVTGVCISNDTNPEPEIDTDGDGVPDDQDAFPNDPNESVDSDGDGIGDNSDFAPDDPTDGKDSGEGDEKDNFASGGADCKSPPSCSGDGIQCAQLYQLWRARCAVEGQGGSVTGSPGTCGASYSCTGNSVACAQLAVQRQMLCGTGAGDGDGNGTVTGTGSCESSYICSGGDAAACAQLHEMHKLRCAIKSLTEGDGDDNLGQEYEPGDFFGVGAESQDLGLLDSSGWLGNRSCPAYGDPTLSGMGGGVDDGLRSLCDGAAVYGIYILILGFIHAAFILGRAASGSST